MRDFFENYQYFMIGLITSLITHGSTNRDLRNGVDPKATFSTSNTWNYTAGVCLMIIALRHARPDEFNNLVDPQIQRTGLFFAIGFGVGLGGMSVIDYLNPSNMTP